MEKKSVNNELEITVADMTLIRPSGESQHSRDVLILRRLEDGRYQIAYLGSSKNRDDKEKGTENEKE